MVEDTQTDCRVFPTNCLNVFGHFVGLALKGLVRSETERYTIFKKWIRTNKNTQYAKNELATMNT